MWQGVLGHDAVIERFRRGLAHDRLAGAYLFAGPAGVGKRTLALKLAQALLCEQSPDALEICGRCASCRMVESGAHPDLDYLAKPAEKSFIPLELLIGDRDHRMQEGLCHRISLKPARGGRKIAILDDADYLNQEGANCLLKTLEEPPPRAMIVLIATGASRQLPTIRSRAQLVLFAPLADDDLAALIVAQGLAPDAAAAARLAAQAGGSISTALQMSEPETAQFRAAWLKALAAATLDPLALEAQVTAYVEAAGSQAADRRARLRLAAEAAAEFYRRAMRQACGATVGPPVAGPPLDETIATDALLRCLQAMHEVDRNANQATLIAAWIDDLSRLAAGEPPVASDVA
jgi:DNA polymerase-3 subunit delta'